MEKFTLLVFITLFLSYNLGKSVLNENGDFTKISNLISFEEFEKIKDFTLKNGDKMTFRNFDNNNPHYKFENCDIFFGADIGQRNINNSPETSDFNELTITDWDSEIIYYKLIIVRKGDLKSGKHLVRKGMKEKQVYLLDTYGKGLELLKSNLPNYLKQIKEKITTTNKGCN